MDSLSMARNRWFILVSGVAFFSSLSVWIAPFYAPGPLLVLFGFGAMAATGFVVHARHNSGPQARWRLRSERLPQILGAALGLVGVATLYGWLRQSEVAAGLLVGWGRGLW